MQDTVYTYIVSLGCSKNFVDTEVMAASLITNNVGITDNMEEADVCLINTCAFIPPARDEAEENIEIAIEWKLEDPKNRKLIVSGCLIQWDKQHAYIEKYPEVDLWLGIDELVNLPEKISNLYADRLDENLIFTEKPTYLYDHKTPRLQLTPEHYANVKIAEGCNNRCSYCAIPGIRGDLRSRSIDSVVKEVGGLLSNGVKELLIIAQDITAFSDDKNNSENLSGLLKELDKFDGDYWLRLHYLHPEGITDELIETIANSKHIIPYLDIPIQHAADNVLNLMNRRISQKNLNDIMGKLRKGIKNLVLRTTFLVGFPGESESDFEVLKSFVRKWKFDRFGVFPFYPEPNTPAAEMSNQISPELADERAKILNSIYEENSKKFNAGLIGKEYKVIIDHSDENSLIGRTYMDSPDIDNIVKIKKTNSVDVGDFCNVRISGASAFELNGELIDSIQN
jgi:ribosomal protein S12 methylthiotransferase